MEVEQVTPELVRITRDHDRWYMLLPAGLLLHPDTGELYLDEDAEDELDSLIAQIEPYPSTTWIAGYAPSSSAPLMQWVAKYGSYDEAMLVRDAAGDRGTRVHNALERIVTEGSLTLKEFGYPEEWYLVQAGVNALKRLQPEILAVEYNFHHETEGMRYGGTVDLKCRVDINRLLPLRGRSSELPAIEPAGESLTVILDYKTSAGVYPSHVAQLGAYAVADDDTGDFDKAFIVQLGTKHKTWSGMNGPGFALHEIDVAEGFGLFKAAYIGWQRENKGARPHIESFPTELSL